MKLQNPRTKLQRNFKSKHQKPAVARLELDVWFFSGAWCLGFGAFLNEMKKEHRTRTPNAEWTMCFEDEDHLRLASAQQARTRTRTRTRTMSADAHLTRGAKDVLFCWVFCEFI